MQGQYHFLSMYPLEYNLLTYRGEKTLPCCDGDLYGPDIFTTP